MKKKKKIKCCDSTCKGCYHYDWRVQVCVFILDTGVRRPCKAGEGCTQRKEGKKRLNSDELMPGVAPKTVILPFNWWKEHAREE